MTDMKWPETPEPYWRKAFAAKPFQPLKEDITADVAVVGGGITGITAAYLLAREGVDVVLLEADRLLNGTTGHTTAKLTAQHGLFYDELIQHMGKRAARLYYEANRDAIAFVQDTASDLGIDCEFTEQDAVVYATTERTAALVEKEAKAYETLGIEGKRLGEIPFDLPVKNAIVMKDQAQFHPIKFLGRLVEELTAKGVRIFEGTTAVDVEKGHQPTVITREGFRVTCRKVLACSHFPFYEWQGLYFTRMYAERAYILAVKAAKAYPGGMYINAESPSRSLRSLKIGGEEVVLVAGENHKTGQGRDTWEHYKALADFAERVVGAENILYRWSAQDLYTLDKIPYIGPITSGYPDVLVATGYKKWGMTSGILAAHLMRDNVLNRKNPYQSLFSPSRFSIDPSLKKFLLVNGDVAKHLIQGKLEVPTATPNHLAKGEGGIVSYKGKRAGAYRDDDGRLHIVDATCTHLGCELQWNRGDRTWDCPCHGSRFSTDGDIIEGPAEQPLTKMEG